MVYAAAGAAHFDGLMVLTLLGAILLLERATVEKGAWAAWGSAALLGMSAAFKVVPLALVPVWFLRSVGGAAWWTLPIVVAVPVGLAAWYGFPVVPVFAALGRFGRDFRVNDAVWWIVDAWIPPGGGAGADRGGGGLRRVGGVVAAGLAAGGVVGDGGGAVAQPGGHAWYVLWVLPLAVWRGGTAARAWFVLSVSMFGYFLLWEVNHDSGRPWAEPLWLRTLILPAAVGGVVAIPGAENVVERQNSMNAAHPNPGRSRPALILPACHEEETIGPVLDELLAKLDPQEGWIVAVGVNGSPVGADRTAELARRHPLAPIVAETPARGYGHGCQAAIDRMEALGLAPDAYVFFAADGANDPAELDKLLKARCAGVRFRDGLPHVAAATGKPRGDGLVARPGQPSARRVVRRVDGPEIPRHRAAAVD